MSKKIYEKKKKRLKASKCFLFYNSIQMWIITAYNKRKQKKRRLNINIYTVYSTRFSASAFNALISC